MASSVAAAVSPRGVPGSTGNVHHPFAVLTEAEEKKKREAAAAASGRPARGIPSSSPPTRNRSSIGAPRPPTTTTAATASSPPSSVRSPVQQRGVSATKRLSATNSSSTNVTAPSHGRTSPSPSYNHAHGGKPTPSKKLERPAPDTSKTLSPVGLPAGGLSISTSSTNTAAAPTVLTPAVMAVEEDLSPMPPAAAANTANDAASAATGAEVTTNGSPPTGRKSPWPVPVKDTPTEATTEATTTAPAKVESWFPDSRYPREAPAAAATTTVTTPSTVVVEPPAAAITAAPSTAPVVPQTTIAAPANDSFFPSRTTTPPPSTVSSIPVAPVPSSHGVAPSSPSVALAIYEQSLSEHQSLIPGSPISPMGASMETPLSMTISPMATTQPLPSSTGVVDPSAHLDVLASVSMDASAPPTPQSRAVAVEMAPFEPPLSPLDPLTSSTADPVVTVTTESVSRTATINPPPSSTSAADSIATTVKRPMPPSHEPPSPVPYNIGAGSRTKPTPGSTTKRRAPRSNSTSRPPIPIVPSSSSSGGVPTRAEQSSPVDAVNAARARIRAAKQAERQKAADRAAVAAAEKALAHAERVAARAPADRYGLTSDGEYVDEFVNEFNGNNGETRDPLDESPSAVVSAAEAAEQPATVTATTTVTDDSTTSSMPPAPARIASQFRLGEPQPPQDVNGELLEPSATVVDTIPATAPRRRRIRHRASSLIPAPVAEGPPLVRRVDETTAYANRIRAQFYRKARLREIDIEMTKRAASQRRAAARAVRERAAATQAADEYQNRLRAHELQGINESGDNLPPSALPGLRLRPQSASSQTPGQSQAAYRQVLASQKQALSEALRGAMAHHDRQLDEDLGRHATIHHSRWAALSAALGARVTGTAGPSKRRNAWGLHDPRLGKGGDVPPETAYNSVRPSSTIAHGTVSPAQPLPSERARSVASNQGTYLPTKQVTPPAPPAWRSGNSQPTDAAVIEAQMVNQSARQALQNYYHLMGQLRSSVHRARAPNVVHHVLFGSPAILQPLARPPTASPTGVSSSARARSTSSPVRARSPQKTPHSASSSLNGLAAARALQRHEPEPRSTWDNKITFPKNADPIPRYDAITDPHARNLTSPRSRRHIAKTRGTTLNPFMSNFLDQRVAEQQHDNIKRDNAAMSKAEADKEAVRAAHARILGKPFAPSPRYDSQWHHDNMHGVEEEKHADETLAIGYDHEEYKESEPMLPPGIEGPPVPLYHVLNGPSPGTRPPSSAGAAATAMPRDRTTPIDSSPVAATDFPPLDTTTPANIDHTHNSNGASTINESPDEPVDDDDHDGHDDDEPSPEPDWAALIALWPAEPSRLSESLISLGVFQAPVGTLPPPLAAPLATAYQSLHELFGLLCTTQSQQLSFLQSYGIPSTLPADHDTPDSTVSSTLLPLTIRAITSLVEARLHVFEAVSAIDEREQCLQAINTSSSGEQTRSLIASMANLDMLAITAINAWHTSLPWWRDIRFMYRGEDYATKIKAQQALFESSSRPGSPSPSPSRAGHLNGDSSTPRSGSDGHVINGSHLYPPVTNSRPPSSMAPLANLGMPRYQPPMTVFESPLPPPSPIQPASSAPPSRARSARSPRSPADKGTNSPVRASTAATTTRSPNNAAAATILPAASSSRPSTSGSPRKELAIISPTNQGNGNDAPADGAISDKVHTSLAAEDLAFLTDPRQVARAAAGLIIQRNKADANAIHRSLHSALHTF